MYTTITLNHPFPIGQTAPNFRLSDHTHTARTLDEMLGSSGILLAFVGDLWQPENVHRLLGLQGVAPKVACLGSPIVAIVNSSVNTLSNFMLSSPLPIPFPLLSDPTGEVHKAYGAAGAPALVLLDSNRIQRVRWSLTSGQMLPPVDDIVDAATQLKETARQPEG